jgi:hypothetical protein
MPVRPGQSRRAKVFKTRKMRPWLVAALENHCIIREKPGRTGVGYRGRILYIG